VATSKFGYYIFGLKNGRLGIAEQLRMRVYKFLCKKFALDNLTKRRIKISEYSDMNDPFELRGVALSDPKLQSQLTHLIRSSGALCFSRNWRNPVLWSHYGDKHKGICLGLDIGAAVEVQEACYVETQQALNADALLAAAAQIETPEADVAFQETVVVERFRVPPPAVVANPAFSEVEKVVKALLLTKFKAWDYEDEVRILIGLREDQKEDTLYFAEFDENIQPSMVIVGPRCSVTKSEIEGAISGYSMPITIVQARLSPASYEVIEDTSGFNRD
jgi:hypothetical protein